MAYPANWAMLAENLTWSQQNGWTVTQQWRGPAGPGKSSRSAWLTEWQAVNGAYVSLTFSDSLPTLDGEAVCEATITYASDPAGEPIPPEGDDYGLIQRQWVLAAQDQQLSIRESPAVEALAEFAPDWPSFIRTYVAEFKVLTAAAHRGLYDENGEPVLPVVMPKWRIPVPPPEYGTPSAELLSNAETLAELLLKDEAPMFDWTQYELRKSETVTSWSTMVVAHEAINRMLNWTALAGAEPTLPGTGLIQTAGLEDLLWLKKAPEVTVTSGGNYELSQDYVSLKTPEAGSRREGELLLRYGEVITSWPPP